MVAKKLMRGTSFLVASHLVLCHTAAIAAEPAPAPLASQKVATWRQALQTAYAFNPQIKIAQTKVKTAKDKKRVAQGEWVPTASGNASYTVNSQEYSKPIENPTAGDALSRPKRLGIAASQNIFASWGSVARWESAEAGVQAEMLDMLEVESAVFVELMKVILEIIVARELKNFYEGNIKISETLLAQTRARARVGEINRTDVFMAEAKLAESEARYVEADSRLEVAKTQFFEMTGQEASENFVWPVIGMGFPQSSKELSQLALRSNFSVRSQAFRERSARKDVHSQLSNQMLPSIDLKADAARTMGDQTNYAGSRQARYKDNQTDLSGVLSLKVPIPFGSEQAIVRQSEQAFNQTRLQRQRAQLNVYQAVLKARNQQIAAERSVQRYETELRANEKALAAMRAEYAHGGRTYIDVSEIQSRKEQSYQNWLEARKREMVERLQILSLTGKFTAKSLKLDVNLYNPDSYTPWLGLAPETPAPILLTTQKG